MLIRLQAHHLRLFAIIYSHGFVSRLRSNRVYDISFNRRRNYWLPCYFSRFNNWIFQNRFQLWFLRDIQLDDVNFLIQCWLWSHLLNHPILRITRPHRSAFGCLHDRTASTLKGFLGSSTFVVLDCEANADLRVAHFVLCRLLISSIHGGISSWPLSSIIHTFKVELRIICKLRYWILSLSVYMNDTTLAHLVLDSYQFLVIFIDLHWWVSFGLLDFIQMEGYILFQVQNSIF